MTDADGADFPPETNPRYKEMHDRDFPRYDAPAEDDEELDALIGRWQHPFAREEKDTSLRPRPGETAEDTINRVVAAVRREARAEEFSETLHSDDDALN